ncbi:hypothetical protein ACIGW7_37920 [Streptomyces sp. NPDC053253]
MPRQQGGPDSYCRTQSRWQRGRSCCALRPPALTYPYEIAVP